MFKKFLAAVPAIMLFFSASAFVPGKKKLSFLTPKIEQRFIEEFGLLDDVEWSNTENNLVQASFKIDNQTADAFFDADGNYVLSTMQTEKENLPLKLKIAVGRKLEGESINAILQMNNNDETAWFIQTTSTKGTRVWKGYASGNISLFKKLK